MTEVEATRVDDEEFIPVNVEPIMAPSPTVDQLRHAEYTKPGGADALYMKWQAGEGTEEEWLAERERVRALYPDPDLEELLPENNSEEE